MQLKLYQKKLLYYLTYNSRFSNKDLSSLLKVSEDTINYNKELFKKNNLFDYMVFFNYKKLGFKVNHLLLKIKDLKKINWDAFLKIKNLSYVNTFVGSFDLHIVFLSKNNQDKENKVFEINNFLKNDVISYEYFEYEKELELNHFLPDYNFKDIPLPKNQKNIFYKLKSPKPLNDTTNINLDEIDLKIINCLIKNPNLSLIEIHKITKFSRETIKNHLYNLIEKNFLVSFSIFPNLKKFNYYTNCIFLKLDKIDENLIKNFIFSNDFIFYCERCVGSKNLFLYVWSKSPEDFSNQYKQIKMVLGTQILEAELLFFDELKFQLEFPNSLFSN